MKDNKSSHKYTLETIAQMRLDKKAELQASKEMINELCRELFLPPESNNKIEGLMHHVNAGIAAYEGLMTGLKIFRKIRGFFYGRRHRSKR
ncbi:hypothetical protein [uncultured Bacteroides sp.]|uniref:hypothetical protein n=1 Tax=uncultured Bacteroides sp. TaxID=162156 RepID=UPI0026168C4A|nr:hypothetical protein [uncultured Bacteroides sp.]